MSSESEYELVEITHFINPHLFWINRIEDDDTEYKLFYSKLQNIAEQSGTCMPQLKKVYAFKDPVKNIWARGVIELDIDLKIAQSFVNNKKQDKSYKVWLVDEGRPIDVSQLPHRLPPEFREKETKCERCILFGVIPAITDLNLSLEVFEKRRICEWQMSAKTLIKELLSRKNTQVYFKTRKYLENVVIGDLQIVLKNKLYNIAEYLVEKGFAFMDEKNFLKVQKHIILEPAYRVKTPSDTQSRPPSIPSPSISNQSRSISSQLGNQKITSNPSSRSISVQSEIVPKRPTDVISIENTTTDDLDDISDLADSDPPFRAFTKRTNAEKSQTINSSPSSRSVSVQSEPVRKKSTIKNTIADDLDDISDLVNANPPLRALTKRNTSESHTRYRKPIKSDSSSSENEISKFQHTVSIHMKPSSQIKTSPNDSLILNRTAGRGSRRSLKLKQQNKSFESESSEFSESQNESIEFQSELISVGRGTRKLLKSPENTSLSARKKLFTSKDKLISNISGKTPAKKLFTDVISINTIDHTLAMNQDAEFYDNTDSEITSSEENSKIEKNCKTSEVKTCIAVIKNVDESSPEKQILVEEDILGVRRTEDDALFLKRFNEKKVQKLENERKLLELVNRNKKSIEDDSKENILPKQTVVKPSVTKLLKKLKIKKSSSTSTNDQKSSSTSTHSSNMDKPSPSLYESTTSSNDLTDNETINNRKQTKIEGNPTISWPKVNNTHVNIKKLNIMPAGTRIELSNTKKIPSLIRSSNLDSSSTSHYESTTSNNDLTDNETLNKNKQIPTEDNTTISWPQVNDATVNRQKKLNIMPAGSPIKLPNTKKKVSEKQYTRQMSKKTHIQNVNKSEVDIITTESFLERQVKSFQSGRNIKAAESLSPVLNVGGLNSNRFLIHSMKKITPIQNVGQAYLHSDIRKMLTSLNIIELHHLQTYVWPAINRGDNVVAIWPKYTHNKPDENSCMMFLPLMCNTIIENNYDDLEHFDGPIVLILCAHKTAARIIYEKTCLLLSFIIKREQFERAQKSKNKPYNEKISIKNRAYLLLDNIDIIRGDIVISTPKCFMNRLSQMRGYATEFRRLCHLVIDDADIITDRYFTELSEILSQCQSSLNRRRNAIRNIQLILTGEKWTKGVEEICKKSQIKPAICIETQIEAAIYAKVNMNLQFIRKETKNEVLYELINKKIPTFKTLLMCNKYSEIEQVVNFLNTKGIEALSFQKRVTGTEIKHTFDQWNTAPPGAYKLLVLTDDVLADISITSAMWLIHYTLPRTWTHFSNRFHTLTANYLSFYTTPNKSIASPKVHIFIDESHIEVVPRMINFLERLSSNANFTKLLPLKEAAILAKEEKKLQTKNMKLCYFLLSTGVCPNEYRCNKRHLLFSNIDSPKFSSIKIGSSIKLKLIEQYDAIHYSARLIDSENEYKLLSLDLASYYRENRGELTIIDINKIYACKNTKTLYERCKIIEKPSGISSTSKEYFKILLIDTGEVKNVKLENLFDLPECFTKDESEQLALDVFIANVKPSHNEIIWDIENLTKLKKILSDINIYDPNIYITCDVQLTIGNCIWIDNVKIVEQFSNLSSCLERLNLTYELEREHIIEKNPMHLKNLIELCEHAKIDLKYQEKNELIEKTCKKINKMELKIQNAFLEVGNDFEQVFFLSTDVGTKFYLGRYEFNKILTQLLNDILQSATDSLYPKEVDIVENNYCLAWMPEEKLYYRAQIRQILSDQQMKCFLIDEGYEETFNKNDLRSIRHWMLTKLPAQSIPCRLFGVQYNSSILERFEDMYETLWAKCVQRDPDGIHAVLLIQKCYGNNLIINNIALEEPDTKPISLEVFQDDDFILQEIDERNSDQEIIDEIDTANLNRPNNIFDLVDLDGETDVSEDEGVCIHNPEEFFKGLLHFEGPPINEYKNKLKNKIKKEDNKNESQTEYSNKIIDPENEEIVSTGLLPTVLWHQTENIIVLKIQLSNIKIYDLLITKDSLLFRTDYDGKFYELNLSLYEDIDDTNYFNEAKGLEIVIKLTKLNKGSKWPRLLKSKQRFRNIKQNLDLALSDDEEDGKKFVPFLQEFSQLEDDETDEDEFRYEIGSDEDDSSDWCSDKGCDS